MPIISRLFVLVRAGPNQILEFPWGRNLFILHRPLNRNGLGQAITENYKLVKLQQEWYESTIIPLWLHNHYNMTFVEQRCVLKKTIRNRSIINRLFGADNRPKHYRCTSNQICWISWLLAHWVWYNEVHVASDRRVSHVLIFRAWCYVFFVAQFLGNIENVEQNCRGGKCGKEKCDKRNKICAVATSQPQNSFMHLTLPFTLLLISVKADAYFILLRV